MTAKPINLPPTIDPRGADMSEAGKLGAGAVRMAHESMAPVERIHGALPLSPHVHPSGGVGGTIRGAEPPPVAQRRMGTAGNGEEWFPDHPSQISAGMPHASREERAALGGKGSVVERAHQDTASTLPDERRDQGSASASPPPAPEGSSAGAPTGFRPGGALDTRLALAPGADEFPPGGEKNYGMESPSGTTGDLPAPYGSEFAERHVGVQATDLPDHLPDHFTTDQLASYGQSADNFGMSSPPGTHGDDPSHYPLPGTQADLPVHAALEHLPQTISPEQMAQDALGGRWGTAWPAGLNGEKDK